MIFIDQKNRDWIVYKILTGASTQTKRRSAEPFLNYDTLKIMTRREIIKYSGIVLAFNNPLSLFTKYNHMTDQNKFDIIIIGGSYAGLSAAMALGRSLRKVLIIDSGSPCNRQTPHTHNLITRDGEAPAVITQKAKEQVLKYKTVKFLSGLAVDGKKTSDGYTISIDTGEEFIASKLIFATGVKDNLPELKGLSECWGISVIHCPYCHGYEVTNQKTGILANGDIAYHYAQLIYNWTKDLTIFTNGVPTFSQEQLQKLESNNIEIYSEEIGYLKHNAGKVEQIIFKDNSTFKLKAIYTRPDFEQHCKIPAKLGCELTEQGHLKVDMFQKTNVNGIFACGDNTTPFRSVSQAISAGNIAGAVLNNEMIASEF